MKPKISTPTPTSTIPSHSRMFGRSPKKIVAKIATITKLSLSTGATFEASLHADREGTLARLRSQLAPFVLRRTKKEVATELPPKMEMDLICPLTDVQRTEYARICSEGLDRLGDVNDIPLIQLLGTRLYGGLTRDGCYGYNCPDLVPMDQAGKSEAELTAGAAPAAPKPEPKKPDNGFPTATSKKPNAPGVTPGKLHASRDTLVDPSEPFAHEVGRRSHRVADVRCSFRDRQNLPLGLGEKILGIARAIVDQSSDLRGVADDLRVILGVRAGRFALPEFRKMPPRSRRSASRLFGGRRSLSMLMGFLAEVVNAMEPAADSSPMPPAI